jgi:manganese transport protein
MGTLVNRGLTTIVASVCAVVIVLLNILLIFQSAGGSIPGVS